MLGADGVGHERLGVVEVAVRRGAVVDARRRREVRTEDVDAEHVEHARIHAPPLPMAGRDEPVPIEPVLLGEGVEEGGARVVHGLCLSAAADARGPVDVLAIAVGDRRLPAHRMEAIG